MKNHKKYCECQQSLLTSVNKIFLYIICMSVTTRIQFQNDFYRYANGGNMENKKKNTERKQITGDSKDKITSSSYSKWAIPPRG